MTDKLQQALQLHRSGEVNKAHDIYTELLTENPHNAAVVYLISLIALQINKHLDAVNLIVHAVKTDPNEPLYYFALGYLAQELNWDEQSLQAYQQLIVLQPKHPQALSNLGRLHTEFNRYEEAMRCYQAALKLDPKTYAAYIGLAITLRRMGLHEDALETLGIALKLRPDIILEGESPEDALTRLNQSQAILYQPPVTIPQSKSTVESPHIAKPKPKLRILHQLPISGGALISKCLAVLPECTLFNNIHPRNGEVPNHGQNIFAQAANWYQLFSEEDKAKLGGQAVDYANGIRMIYDRLQERDQCMLIRSWSHLDFIGFPFIADPQGTLALSDLLREDFELLEAATLRHPIDNWIHLQKLHIMRDKLGLDDYMKGYYNFVQSVESMTVVRYEDFAKEPDAHIEKLCNALEIPFNPIYRERWKFESHIVGEPGDHPEKIEPIVPKDYETSLLEMFEANFNYWPALKITAYDHPEANTTSA